MTTDHDILAKPLFSEDCDMAHRADQWSFPKGIARDAMVASDMDVRSEKMSDDGNLDELE